jgi:hypothetical protein
MSCLWSVEYQRKDSDTKECLWVSVDEPMSMARADLKAARVNVRILARKEGSRVTLWSRYGANSTDRLPKGAEGVCSLVAEER